MPKTYQPLKTERLVVLMTKELKGQMREWPNVNWSHTARFAFARKIELLKEEEQKLRKKRKCYKC